MATIPSQMYWYFNLELPSGVKPLEQRVVVEPVDRTQDRLWNYWNWLSAFARADFSPSGVNSIDWTIKRQNFDNLLYSYSVTNRKPNMHDVFALLEEVPAKDFNTDRPLTLHRWQIGTVVMIYPDGACEVEFADRYGRAHAILPIQADRSMVLYDAAA